MSGFGSENLGVPGAALEKAVSEGIRVYPKQTRWSFSAVSGHEKCPLQFRFRRIDRLPEPQLPHMQRGLDMHEALGRYLQSGQRMDDAPFKPEWYPTLDVIIASTTRRFIEAKICFNKDWHRVEAKAADLWLTMILDLLVVDTNGGALVIDFKTGKVYAEHKTQGKLYALGVLLADPTIQEVSVGCWYLDLPVSKGTPPTDIYNRDDIPHLKESFRDYTQAFFADDTYPARPSPLCGWCHFRASNKGPCVYG